MKLTAVFEPAKEGGYTCFVEEVPAAISQGETLGEAKVNLLDALKLVLERGQVGESYNIGGNCEKTNLDVVHTLCDLFDALVPVDRSYRDLITFVADRPGHDQRYAIDASKIARELAWRPTENFESGLRKTVEWYLSNRAWWQAIHDGSYRGERLGLIAAET